MRRVRLKISRPWLQELEEKAAERNVSLEELLLGAIALSFPPKTRKSSAHTEEIDPLLSGVRQLVTTLDQARAELATALNRLTPARPPSRAMLRRRRRAEVFRRALKKSGLTQRDIAARLGVGRPMVSFVVREKSTLPPAWYSELDKIFGEGWRDELAGE